MSVHSPSAHTQPGAAKTVADLWAAFEADVIAYDPFAGDFGSPGDKAFVDKMVVARRPHPECHTCGCPIQMGERHRYKCDRIDGELMSWRWCWACCVAMARSWQPWADHMELPPYAEIEDRESARFAAAWLTATAPVETDSVGTKPEGRSAPNTPGEGEGL